MKAKIKLISAKAESKDSSLGLAELGNSEKRLLHNSRTVSERKLDCGDKNCLRAFLSVFTYARPHQACTCVILPSHVNLYNKCSESQACQYRVSQVHSRQ